MEETSPPLSQRLALEAQNVTFEGMMSHWGLGFDDGGDELMESWHVLKGRNPNSWRNGIWRLNDSSNMLNDLLSSPKHHP
jgi:hypothetical protein